MLIGAVPSDLIKGFRILWGNPFLETHAAVNETQRLTGQLDLLEQHFPVGFGELAQAVRGWSDDA